MIPFKKVLVPLVVFSCGILYHAAAEEEKSAASTDTSEYRSFLNSFNLTEEEFESRVGSTKMFGGSSPVSFSGEGRVKIQFHNLETDMECLQTDRSYFQSGWEGNESLLRFGMVARAGRNTMLYSKIGFQHSMQGNRWTKEEADKGGADGPRAQTRHDKMLVTANIHEDMSAGIAVRTRPASFWMRMGNINWIEASPFTVWKSQPRTFAWEFLPFEIEQPIARYYEYNIAVGEKAGRAAWHKKAFNGVNFESINLPANLYLDMLWGTYERFDNYEREYADFAGDITYTDPFPLKASGIGDSYRHLFHARLAQSKLLGNLTLGLNFNRFHVNEDIFTIQDGTQDRFLQNFGITGKLDSAESLDGTGFFKEPTIFSVDLRGLMAKGLFDLHSDIALSRVDTTYLTWSSEDSSERYSTRVKSTDFIPAFYTRLTVNTKLPFQAEVAVIGKGFYSPMSFAAPNDAFYAFGANLVGSGKFLARHEASPYVQNMAGVLLSVMPKLPGYGHFRVSYGQHMQLDKGRDLLYIPYRLNGLDLFTIPHSSYNRWANGQVFDNPLPDDYGRRLGDESFSTFANSKKSLENGGISMDYLSTTECFVAYPDSDMAMKNTKSMVRVVDRTRVYTKNGVSDTSASGFVPMNRKFTNNFEVDVAYDISDIIGYPHNLFLGGYAALNNVATAFTAFATGDKDDDVQLWSVYLRFEPAIQLSKKFYLLGILGLENWRSQKAWMNVKRTDLEYVADEYARAWSDTSTFINVPIDYRDIAIGLGFDWEILSRVGLHGRAKYMRHKDMAYKKNDWSTPIVSMEIKTWF